MKPFLFFCFVFCVCLTIIGTLSPSHALAQEADEPVVQFTQPKPVSGDPVRCAIDSIANGSHMTITFLDATAFSRTLDQDSLKCRVELSATMQLAKGWYFHSIQQTIDGSITPSNAKAAIRVQTTFQKKPVLRFRATQPSPLFQRANRILVDFVASKSKQCSGAIQTVTGAISLDLNAQVRANAQAKLDAFDIDLIPTRCDL
jgi:hypothetical protein